MAADLGDGTGAAYYTYIANEGWIRLVGAIPDETRIVEVEMEADFQLSVPAIAYRIDGATLRAAEDATRTTFPTTGTAERLHSLGFSGNGRLGAFDGTWRDEEVDASTSVLVHLDPNGATETATSQTFTLGTEMTLATPAYEMNGCRLAGWALTPGGPAVLPPAADLRLVAARGGVAALYAVWTRE